MENLHITIEIKAPAIVDAIELLALAISNQSKLLNPQPVTINIPVSESKTEPVPIAEDQTENSKTEEKEISEVEIRAKFVALSKKGKKAELKKLLTDFGVEKVSDLQPDQYQNAMAKLEAI